MKLCKKLCILLSALLIAQLCAGCRLIPPSAEHTAPNLNTVGGRYGNPDDWANAGNIQQGDLLGETGTDPAEDAVSWEVDYRLNISFTPADGLELPVEGATGYASVELYLWADMPGDAGKKTSVRSQIDTTPATASPEVSTVVPGGTGATTTMPEAVIDPNWGNNTGYTTSGTYVETYNSSPNSAITKLSPGTAFMIIQEVGDWWQVRVDGKKGWVEHRYCLINLPDVVPSIIYDDTNSYGSVFRSAGKDIPMITERALYNALAYNPRLGRDEFMMPVLYAMAKNVCRAQQNALAEGNTIVLYEAYRPYETQMEVVRAVQSLAAVDADVRRGISTPPWDISWFIATGISNHQQGYAMDVSLAKVIDAEIKTIGGHSFVNITESECYTMPTPIHELSMAAVTYTRPVAIFSTTAWQNATMSATMAANEPAKALQRYCTQASLTPLASEWWHFNDLAAYNRVSGFLSRGNYFITDCFSLPPELVAS